MSTPHLNIPKIVTKPRPTFLLSPRKEPPELRTKRIRDKKPSKKFHDFHTIQWLRTRYGENLIQKSIFSLLPDNGKPVVPEDETEDEKKQRLLMEWLDTYAKIPDRFRHVNINPKYFFNDKTFEKVLKLKEIFLSFDEDGSRKMEINEMEEMFNANNINATVNELISLFFKDKTIKQEDIMSLYLDFYQFMTFALTKEQDFRLFMRKIKEKYKQSGESENGFLPMSFNLMLDYFIIKGKDRTSVDVIEKAIDEMDKIMVTVNGKKRRKTLKRTNTRRRSVMLEDDINNNNGGNVNGVIDNNNNKVEAQENNNNDANNNNNNNNSTNDKYTIDSTNINYDSQLESINFKQLINEFQNLFRIKDDTKNTTNYSHSSSKRKGTTNRTPNTKTFSLFPTKKNSSINITTLQSPGDITPRYIKSNTIIPNKEETLSPRDNANVPTSNENEHCFYNKVHTQLLKDEIQKMNHSNYEKFHSLHLAIQETKKVIEKRKKFLNGEMSSNYNTTCSNANNSTMNATSRLLPRIEWNRPESSVKYHQRELSTMSVVKKRVLSRTFIKDRKRKDFVPFKYINK